MGKQIDTSQATVFCGIDVSAATLAVAVIEQDQPLHQREFANRASGRWKQPAFTRWTWRWLWIGRRTSRWQY